MLAEAIVEVVVEEEVAEVVEEEEVEGAEVTEEEAMTTMTMTMMTMVHLPSDQVHPAADERDEGFSTIRKWSSN